MPSNQWERWCHGVVSPGTYVVQTPSPRASWARRGLYQRRAKAAVRPPRQLGELLGDVGTGAVVLTDLLTGTAGRRVRARGVPSADRGAASTVAPIGLRATRATFLGTARGSRRRDHRRPTCDRRGQAVPPKSASRGRSGHRAGYALSLTGTQRARTAPGGAW